MLCDDVVVKKDKAYIIFTALLDEDDNATAILGVILPLLVKFVKHNKVPEPPSCFQTKHQDIGVRGAHHIHIEQDVLVIAKA